MKTVKTLICAAVLAVTAFSANANLQLTDNSAGFRFTTNDSYNTVIASNGIDNSSRWYETTRIYDQINNEGLRYNAVFYAKEGNKHYTMMIIFYENGNHRVIMFNRASVMYSTLFTN